MIQDDIGQLSSFQNNVNEKGLLTFYEEQWLQKCQNAKKQTDTSEQKKKLSIQKEKKKMKLVQKTIKNEDNQFKTEKYDRLTHRQALFSISNHVQVQRMPRKTPLNSFNFQSLQSQILRNSIEKSLIFDKSKKIIPRLKKKGSIKPVPIKSYPFEQQEESQKQNLKYKSQLINLRLRKGSSFKSLYEADRKYFNQIKKNDQRKNQQFYPILQKNQSLQNTQKKDLKNPTGYLFPIISPQFLHLRQRSGNQEYEDSLSQFYARIKHRQQRNTDNLIKRIYNQNEYS